ncbi:MAG TPA: hypothetical protein VN971_07300 [Thermoanaerobaculia bacterium]|nr:hypothetical protein [Thermoanaerobaculia bacterium]
MRRLRRAPVALSFVLVAALFVPLALSAGTDSIASRYRAPSACGTERWGVKTLTDPAAGSVDYAHVANSSVTALGQVHSSTQTPARRPEEKRVYRIRVRLDSLPGRKLGFKIESNDSDIHLAVRDAAGATMIVEFPDFNCTQGAQRRLAMKQTRAALVSACGQPPRGKFHELHGSATITGVFFFDFPHGQRGHARNYAELHPALSFKGVCSAS